MGSVIVIFIDHSALKYLLTKQDAKARLIRWVFLLQEFNLQIKDKKGVENVVADHLSRLTIDHDSHSPPLMMSSLRSLCYLYRMPLGMLILLIIYQQGRSRLIGKHRTRNTSSLKFIPIIGRNHSCLNTVQIKSSEGVYLKRNNRGSLTTAMRMPVEVILLHKRQP